MYLIVKYNNIIFFNFYIRLLVPSYLFILIKTRDIIYIFILRHIIQNLVPPQKKKNTKNPIFRCAFWLYTGKCSSFTNLNYNLFNILIPNYSIILCIISVLTFIICNYRHLSLSYCWWILQHCDVYVQII
jgi:hypothetical protein